jgi:DNA replication protein DnaC
MMIQRLQRAKADLKLSEEIAKLDKYQLLILDDIGYAQKDEFETSVLFDLIAHRYESKSLRKLIFLKSPESCARTNDQRPLFYSFFSFKPSPNFLNNF